jgi:hypothetical protein
MRSPKLFACRKTFVSPFSCRPAVAPFALCRRLQERWITITTGENQDAHTKRQRQNRRSRIFQEDGENKTLFLSREWWLSPSLKAGVTVTLSDVSRYGDVQVEIRTNGTLNWRAWSLPEYFLWNEHASQCDLTGGRIRRP